MTPVATPVITTVTTAVRDLTLRVPGAQLYAEVRGRGPVLVLVGAPMDATAFGPLADLMARDHTVLTTDPRGVNRSAVEDPDQDSTPELRADDLSRLLTHLDAGPAVVVGSSGGAISALALAQARPDQVRTVVAHEPPLTELLGDRDRDRHRAQTDEVIATHLSGDVPGAWRMFLANAGIVMPEAVFDAVFGGDRDAREVADQHHWFAHELHSTARWEPDVAALRVGPTRIVVGVGDQSTGQTCDHTSRALAAALGTGTTLFPGDHTGFVGHPAAFATRLREVLEAVADGAGR